jgi:phosphate-selective porin
MQNQKVSLITLAVAGAIALPLASQAGGITYKDGDKYLKIGGRLQLQYYQSKPDGGETTDELFFRRLRPYIEGSLHKDWKGKIQFDLGKAEGENEVAIKDAYFQYKGWSNMKLSIGNANFPFSREFLTSSKKQQLVERTFVGDHNYGTPDRNTGLHLTGNSGGKKITYGASATVASIDPDNDKLDFDTPVNRNDDFNDGFMVGGRVDWHPFGYLKFSQGDFKRELKATIGVAAFSWSNDEDNNTNTPGCLAGSGKCDVDSVTGIEVSGAFRAAGFSIDAEYNSFDAETSEAGITDGIYTNGDTTLTNAAIEGGYMFGDTIELVAGYQTQDADGYATAWNRTSVGANWFLKKHDIKFQLSYRMGENLEGVENNDEDELFLQGQYVF